MNLEPTGERMIMEHYQSSAEDYVIYLLHIATYRFAERFAAGKRVLDYGCGSGYGSARISESAAHVAAVDVAPEAVEHARINFARDNLDFLCIDPVGRLPFADASFDVVLSFQVFEHVTDTGHYLSEIRRVLAPAGQLLLVTPDRSTRLLPLQRPWNRWHVHEYGNVELAALLARYFRNVDVMGMTGPPGMLDIELQRCTKVKWVTLPFTLPMMPDAWRVKALNWLHRLRPQASKMACTDAYPFGIDDVHIGKDVSPSVNLVALAS